MWSPKVSKGGRLNPFYEFMREVAPGDLVFSFADTLIKAIGIATSSCYDCPKPPEFGSAGKVWGQTGWRVDVKWIELKNRIKPGSHMDALSPYLPAKYSPLTPSGSGLQSVYLTHLPPGLADALVALMALRPRTRAAWRIAGFRMSCRRRRPPWRRPNGNRIWRKRSRPIPRCRSPRSGRSS